MKFNPLVSSVLLYRHARFMLKLQKTSGTNRLNEMKFYNDILFILFWLDFNSVSL